MKREIKFRAWEVVQKKMINVFGITKYHITGYYVEDIEEEAMFQINLGAIILMQYTGLKDKNGVEIYEGDLIKVFSHIYRIKFIEKLACFQMFNQDKDMPHDSGFVLNPSAEVIGSIYENPELLKETI